MFTVTKIEHDILFELEVQKTEREIDSLLHTTGTPGFEKLSLTQPKQSLMGL